MHRDRGSRSLSVLSVLLLSSLATTAQSDHRGPVGDTRYVRIHIDTGEIERDCAPFDSEAESRLLPEVKTVDNQGGAAQFYSIPANQGDGYLTWFNKGPVAGDAEESGVVTKIRFSYVSRAQDSNSGGSGASLALGGNTGGDKAIGDPGSIRLFHQLTNLPTGNATEVSGFPTLMVWEAEAVVSAGSLKMDWPWSLSDLALVFISADGHTDGAAASGVVVRATTDNDVFSDDYAYVIDILSNSPSLQQWGPGNSVGFEILELKKLGTPLNVKGSPAAPGVGELTGTLATIGDPWGETLCCNGADAGKVALFKVAYGFARLTPLSSKWGDIWTMSSGFSTFKAHNGGCATFDFGSLPCDLGLHGRVFTTQGFCGDNPTGYLSNAVEHKIDIDRN